jgi:hypothetical protein
MPSIARRRFGTTTLLGAARAQGLCLELRQPRCWLQVSGVVRFRDKVFQLVASREVTDDMDDVTLRLMHKTIKKVGAPVACFRGNARW